MVGAEDSAHFWQQPGSGEGHVRFKVGVSSSPLDVSSHCFASLAGRVLSDKDVVDPGFKDLVFRVGFASINDNVGSEHLSVEVVDFFLCALVFLEVLLFKKFDRSLVYNVHRTTEIEVIYNVLSVHLAEVHRDHALARDLRIAPKENDVFA